MTEDLNDGRRGRTERTNGRHAASRTRLRTTSKLAAQYIWRLSLILLL